MLRLFISLALLLTSILSFADTSTGWNKISLIQINDVDAYYYFKTSNGSWGAPECPQAEWVYIRSQEVSVADQMLSAALTAKIAGVNVRFRGTCDSNGNYLRAVSINLE